MAEPGKVRSVTTGHIVKWDGMAAGWLSGFPSRAPQRDWQGDLSAERAPLSGSPVVTGRP
ncbi:hypothetical protein ACFFUB_15345 [Algimonas porphyrae]|uniref:Uncharacterized protein n=1 Tax=Algimonas porphyrae TaxID=1128113 RepID=A0ABQ5UWX0_9PROT|nr:hypothetical protein [Algimonas porphyrae]GLQ19803.1 hypothetical protein GCM10007854_07580 [Algimonas porphyrae]